MKTTERRAMVAIVLGVLGCLIANAQPQPQPVRGRHGNAVGGSSSGGGGGGYTAGGERGSVVQVILSQEVQAELGLSEKQQLQVSNVLCQVNAKEVELFRDFESMMGRHASNLSRDAAQGKKFEEANEQLARATDEIVAQLTVTQRAQLRELCRQALADENDLRQRMAASEGIGGPAGRGGGSGRGLQWLLCERRRRHTTRRVCSRQRSQWLPGEDGKKSGVRWTCRTRRWVGRGLQWLLWGVAAAARSAMSMLPAVVQAEWSASSHTPAFRNNSS